MKILQQTICLLSIFACFLAGAKDSPNYKVFSLLDLDRPELEKVKACCERQKWEKASVELLKYFRSREESISIDENSRLASATDFLYANDALKHTFHFMDDLVWNYGEDINWEYWPIKDIEMRVQLHRHGWWMSLAKSYCTSGEDMYAREYVFELRDWVKKNPYKPFGINQHGTVSSGTIDIDSPNECFAWRPLEVGIRLLRWPRHFVMFKDAESFTPEFLLEFLMSYHQNASVLMQSFSPAGNHLIHQSSGIIRAGICFPEFKDAESWIRQGAENLNREIFRQSYPDGCHYELDPGYHIGFVQSYDDAIQIALQNGKKDLFPKECLEQLVRMTNYYLSYRYPEGTHPCLSDARRHDDLADAELLTNISNYYESPETEQIRWFATNGNEGQEPTYKSVGYPETGFYTFRSGWAAEDIIMPIKATEKGMWHAQPDFGTFELWAYGRILMPDSGAYTYSGDAEIERERAYFKETARHNAVTLDNKNYGDPKPEVIEWRPVDESGVQRLCVQHQAYDGLTRRRSISFIDEKFFVIIDDVSGPSTGCLTLRNCLGQGQLMELSPGNYIYKDGDAGLRILVQGPEDSHVIVEEDWYSETFREKHKRPVIRLDVLRDKDSSSQQFVTVLCPFSGKTPDMVLKNGNCICVDGKDYIIK